jgi:hypothetical protein
MLTEIRAYHDHPQETEKKWVDTQQKLNMVPCPGEAMGMPSASEAEMTERAQAKGPLATLAEEGASRMTVGGLIHHGRQ